MSAGLMSAGPRLGARGGPDGLERRGGRQRLGRGRAGPRAAAAAATDQAQRSLANREFHRALYLACGNGLLVKTLDDLRDQTALVSAPSWEQAPSWQQEAAEHQAILAAARRGARPPERRLRPAPRAHRRVRGPLFPMPARRRRGAQPNGVPMSIDPAVADQLRGVLATVAAIPVTPFGPDGQVDWDAHGRLIRRMVDTGVRLVTPNGNTGEFYALTAAETRGATESAVAAAGDSGQGRRADVLAGVGHDLATAIDAAAARPGRWGAHDHGAPAGRPVLLARWLARLPPDHRRGPARPGRRAVPPGPADRGTPYPAARRPVPQRDRGQVRGRRPGAVRRRGQGRRAWTGSPGWPGWPS